ncbi:hypothetical protein ACTFIR_005762 [Dictyostelium discoideum]
MELSTNLGSSSSIKRKDYPVLNPKRATFPSQEFYLMQALFQDLSEAISETKLIDLFSPNIWGKRLSPKFRRSTPIKILSQQNVTESPWDQARGSGAGSIILYIIGITDIEPLIFNLFFERFINPERLSYLDIDVDICIDRRPEVIQYTINTDGKENVAMIITFGPEMFEKSLVKMPFFGAFFQKNGGWGVKQRFKLHNLRQLLKSFPETSYALEALFYLGIIKFEENSLDIANRYLSAYIEQKNSPEHYEDLFRYKLAIAKRLEEFLEAVESYKEEIRKFSKRTFAITGFTSISTAYLKQIECEPPNNDILALADINLREIQKMFPNSTQVSTIETNIVQMREISAAALYNIGQLYERMKRLKDLKTLYDPAYHEYERQNDAKILSGSWAHFFKLHLEPIYLLKHSAKKSLNSLLLFHMQMEMRPEELTNRIIYAIQSLPKTVIDDIAFQMLIILILDAKEQIGYRQDPDTSKKLSLMRIAQRCSFHTINGENLTKSLGQLADKDIAREVAYIPLYRDINCTVHYATDLHPILCRYRHLKTMNLLLLPMIISGIHGLKLSRYDMALA